MKNTQYESTGSTAVHTLPPSAPPLTVRIHHGQRRVKAQDLRCDLPLQAFQRLPLHLPLPLLLLLLLLRRQRR